jgi:hypothetical protein
LEVLDHEVHLLDAVAFHLAHAGSEAPVDVEFPALARVLGQGLGRALPAVSYLESSPSNL